MCSGKYAASGVRYCKFESNDIIKCCIARRHQAICAMLMQVPVSNCDAHRVYGGGGMSHNQHRSCIFLATLCTRSILCTATLCHAANQIVSKNGYIALEKGLKYMSLKKMYEQHFQFLMRITMLQTSVGRLRTFVFDSKLFYYTLKCRQYVSSKSEQIISAKFLSRDHFESAGSAFRNLSNHFPIFS